MLTLGVIIFLKMDNYRNNFWRCGGVVVSLLDFRFRGLWFEPGLCCCVVSLDKKLYSTLSLFTKVGTSEHSAEGVGGRGADNLAMD